MSDSDNSDSDSDYVVEEFIKPKKVTARLQNNEEGDLLGNFEDTVKVLKKNVSDDEGEDDDDEDDQKPEEEEEYDSDKEIIHKEIQIEEDDSEEEDSDSDDEGSLDDNGVPRKKAKYEEPHSVEKDGLSESQMKKLLIGSSKLNRFVLYVTNLSVESTKPTLEDYFSQSGEVKSIRIPKHRKSNFAFVEMKDAVGFKNAFNLHNSQLDGRQIKVQISEAGKKKSANKKNIMKQKNRVLAEMRNESKSFLKSGKSFGHTQEAKKRMKIKAMSMRKKKK